MQFRIGINAGDVLSEGNDLPASWAFALFWRAACDVPAATASHGVAPNAANGTRRRQ
jgi:hypothetical protein